jgi:hypothetical protein
MTCPISNDHPTAADTHEYRTTRVAVGRSQSRTRGRVLGRRLQDVLRRAGTDHGREVDHPPTEPMPERPQPRPRTGASRASSLPRPRRRAHHLDMPHMRPKGVRTTAQHALHMPRRAGEGAPVDPADGHPLTAIPGATGYFGASRCQRPGLVLFCSVRPWVGRMAAPRRRYSNRYRLPRWPT